MAAHFVALVLICDRCRVLSFLLLDQKAGGARLQQAKFSQDLNVKLTQNMETTKYPELKIGFLGHGKMFQALSVGFLKANIVKPENIMASYRHQVAPLLLAENGIQQINSNSEVVQRCDVIIIAVKPHIVGSVLQEVYHHVQDRHLVISIAAGLKLTSLASMLPPSTKLACVCPNTPALVGCGASVCSFADTATPDNRELVQNLFQTVGLCESLPESYLDIVTGLSGSGPAYAFMAIEALSDGAVRMGLPRDKATKLAAQMMMGAAKMVLETGKHPGELKDAVCSPGGTTIAGVHALEKNGFRAALMDAVQAATTRARELGKQ